MEQVVKRSTCTFVLVVLLSLFLLLWLLWSVSSMFVCGSLCVSVSFSLCLCFCLFSLFFSFFVNLAPLCFSIYFCLSLTQTRVSPHPTCILVGPQPTSILARIWCLRPVSGHLRYHVCARNFWCYFGVCVFLAIGRFSLFTMARFARGGASLLAVASASHVKVHTTKHKTLKNRDFGVRRCFFTVWIWLLILDVNDHKCLARPHEF